MSWLDLFVWIRRCDMFYFVAGLILLLIVWIVETIGGSD
jgi:hypothetical protein